MLGREWTVADTRMQHNGRRKRRESPSGNTENLGIRIEFTNQDVALLRNVCCKPALSHLFLKFSFDFGETLGSNGICVPFCKGLVPAGTNHSKLLQCHVIPSL